MGTYFDDGLRMWFDWVPQTSYMEYAWNCGSFLSNLFVIVNLFGQLVGATLVVSQNYATIACGMLFGITTLQVMWIEYHLNNRFLL